MSLCHTSRNTHVRIYASLGDHLTHSFDTGAVEIWFEAFDAALVSLVRFAFVLDRLEARVLRAGPPPKKGPKQPTPTLHLYDLEARIVKPWFLHQIKPSDSQVKSSCINAFFKRIMQWMTAHTALELADWRGGYVTESMFIVILG